MERQLKLISTGPSPHSHPRCDAEQPNSESKDLPRFQLSRRQVGRAALQSLGRYCLKLGPLALAGSVFFVEGFRGPRELDAFLALAECFLFCFAILAVVTCAAAAREALRIFSTEFRCTPTELIIMEGIIFQREHTLPCCKIVRVEVSQDLAATVFKVADVQIATGPGRYSDGIRISGFEFRDALSLERFLLGPHIGDDKKPQLAWG